MKFRLAHQIIVITFFRLILNTGRRFVYPFAPALSRGLDVPLTAITSIIATGQMTSLLGLFSGPLADRIGYRFMMRTGLGMLAIGMLICGLVPVYWPVFIGLVIASLGKTVFDPAIQAFIGHTVPYERRGRVVGAVETAWAGSTLIGIPALGLIVGRIGLQTSFFILAFLGVLGWFILGRVITADVTISEKDTKTPGVFTTLLQLLKERPTAGMLSFSFWISIANDGLFVVFGAWFEQSFQASIVTLGFSTIAIGAAELIGESMTAFWGDRFGLKRSIVIGACLAVLSYLMLPFIGQSLGLAMLGMFFVFLAFEFMIVSSISLSTELMVHARATMLSGFYASSGVGRMIGVIVGGLLWKVGGIAVVSWAAAACTVIGLLSLFWGLHNWKRDET